MKKSHKSRITADEARRLYEVLNAIDSYPVKDDGSGVHEVYDCIAKLVLLKAGISLNKGENVWSLVKDAQERFLSRYGVSYINACDSSVWDSIGVDEYDVRGALLLGTYLSRMYSSSSFLNDLNEARAYFEEAEDVGEELYPDFMDEFEDEDYEDEEDRAFDTGLIRVVDFIDAVLICLKEGSEQIFDSCVEPFYQVACALDGVYEDNLDLFMEHLPGLLIKVAEPYVSFDYKGNDDKDTISGCLGQRYYLIKDAAAIVPYLKKD